MMRVAIFANGVVLAEIVLWAGLLRESAVSLSRDR